MANKKSKKSKPETTTAQVDVEESTSQSGNALFIIQQKLNAPKSQYNSFGKYKYRSCEDILSAVKPLLKETGATLTLSDDIVPASQRIYVKATATLVTDSGEVYTTTAYAREDEVKKGMDGAQVTGAASSYARKYALNGLFCIDDTKDPDATNTHDQESSDGTTSKGQSQQAQNNVAANVFSGGQIKQALAEIGACKNENEVQAVWVKWVTAVPAFSKNGGEFYNATAAKMQQLRS